jgi:hypothetical protein
VPEPAGFALASLSLIFMLSRKRNGWQLV